MAKKFTVGVLLQVYMDIEVEPEDILDLEEGEEYDDHKLETEVESIITQSCDYDIDFTAREVRVTDINASHVERVIRLEAE